MRWGDDACRGSGVKPVNGKVERQTGDGRGGVKPSNWGRDEGPDNQQYFPAPLLPSLHGSIGGKAKVVEFGAVGYAGCVSNEGRFMGSHPY